MYKNYFFFVDTYVLQNFPLEKYQFPHTFSNTGYYSFSSLLMGEAGKLCVVLFCISLITSEKNIFCVFISHLLVFFSALPIQTSCFFLLLSSSNFCSSFIRTYKYPNSLSFIAAIFPSLSFLSLYMIYFAIQNLCLYVVKSVFSSQLLPSMLKRPLTDQDYKNVRLCFFLLLL